MNTEDEALSIRGTGKLFLAKKKKEFLCRAEWNRFCGGAVTCGKIISEREKRKKCEFEHLAKIDKTKLLQLLYFYYYNYYYKRKKILIYSI